MRFSLKSSLLQLDILRLPGAAGSSQANDPLISCGRMRNECRTGAGSSCVRGLVLCRMREFRRVPPASSRGERTLRCGGRPRRYLSSPATGARPSGPPFRRKGISLLSRLRHPGAGISEGALRCLPPGPARPLFLLSAAGNYEEFTAADVLFHTIVPGIHST